jgi:hypothetical protein
MASEASRLAVVREAAENSSDSSKMVATSASAAAAMTSCPKRVASSPASLSNGSSSPAEVDISTTARNNGRPPRPAPVSAKPEPIPSTTEAANPIPASRPGDPRSPAISISRPARNSSMPRPRSARTVMATSMCTQPSTDGPITMPAITSRTAPGTGRGQEAEDHRHQHRHDAHHDHTSKGDNHVPTPHRSRPAGGCTTSRGGARQVPPHHDNPARPPDPGPGHPILRPAARSAKPAPRGPATAVKCTDSTSTWRHPKSTRYVS